VDPGNRRAVIAALLANLGIAVAKLVAFLFTGAASMLAETVHSAADSTNQALLLWGGAAARRPPTRDHPFGFGRERYFWGFVVALVIFSLGGVFAIVEGVGKLSHPQGLENGAVAIGVLLVGIGLEGWSFRTAVGEARPRLRGRSWWRFVQETKNPELPVVLLEDLGALVGLSLALVGIVLVMLTGNSVFDALGSVAIGILLCVIAAILAREMKSLLIGEGASSELESRLVETMNATASVRRVIHLRTQYLGPDELLVAAKLDFDETLTFTALTHAIDGVESALREIVPEATRIYIEPDVYEAPPPPARDPS
jgi:cation diffusion facilitator family transporter